MFLTSKKLTNIPWLIHGITTRLNGFSKAPYSGLNLSFDVGDDKEAVKKNHEKIKHALGIRDLISLKQKHGVNILEIRDNCFNDREYNDYDAMITDQPGAGLLIKTADCQSVMIVDPVSRVIANIHNGWKGSVADITGKTVSRMKQSWNADPRRMKAFIGPSIGPCCAEYKDHDIFPSWFKEFQASPDYFDFQAITVRQLKLQGISIENIEKAGLCTKCNPGLFYSYRGENKITGRFGAIIGIKLP